MFSSSAASSLASSSVPSSFNLSTNTTASALATPASAASASYTTSTDCRQAHQGAAATTTTTQYEQNQRRRRRKHLYGQKLNNSAVSCIEIGQYDRAISSLSKALQLSEQQDEEEGNHGDSSEEMMTPICSCYHCTVDGCIEYSENNNYAMTKDDPFVCVAVAGETSTDAGSDSSSSYIYRKPIQVAPRSIQEGHNMGSSLCLIISFNLALAYHLKAITTTMTNKNNNKKSSRHQKQDMTVALKLYTHVIRWQTRLIRQNSLAEGSMSSTAASFHDMRLKMILLNNMSQIYRCDIITHEKSYTMCLEFLLSNIMLVVEYKTRISSSSLLSSLPYIMIADLERFLQNISPVSMGRSNYKRRNGGCVQDQCCASAA